mmetsp:Transcript_23384/g.67120  ORF Transcript_23384/g.67120 Transcript_23384/m.67120 type:complete len:153 (+) Transcript_23384:1203-1661(+)
MHIVELKGGRWCFCISTPYLNVVDSVFPPDKAVKPYTYINLSSSNIHVVGDMVLLPSPPDAPLAQLTPAVETVLQQIAHGDGQRYIVFGTEEAVLVFAVVLTMATVPPGSDTTYLEMARGVAEDGFGRVLSPRLELYMKAIDGTYAPPKINT